MRVKFFLIILGSFLFTVAILGAAQYFLSRAERLRLVDQQIEQMASTLYASELSDSRIHDVEESSDIIADVLGDDRLTALISIYDRQGNVIYQNHNAATVKVRLSKASGKEQIEQGGHILRLLTVPFSSQEQLLQVGLFLDKDLLRWHLLNLRLVSYVGFTLLFVSAASYFLSYLLLKPIENLAQYLHHRLLHFDEKWTEAPLAVEPREIGVGKKDAVWRLTQTFQGFLRKMRENLLLNQSRAALIAHEIKTPLTILRNNLETLQRDSSLKSNGQIVQSIEEVEHLTRLVNDFTQWSLFESHPGSSDELHAVRLSQLAREIGARLNGIYENRVTLDADEGTLVFADRRLVEQAVINLMVNSLQYSPPSRSVEVRVRGPVITIRDYGRGIPSEVLNRLGDPFNVGKGSEKNGGQGRGTGLGLAWVSAISRKYGWDFSVKNLSDGVSVLLDMGQSA